LNFRTTLQLPPAPKKITYYTPIVSIGSCFAQNIATRFAYYKFPITANPFGVLFHPIAIQKVIQRALAQQPYTPEDFFLHNELWHSFSLHSDISKPELQETISFANTQQNKLYQALKEAHRKYEYYYLPNDLEAPSKELADAAVALLKLLFLRDYYNDGWKPNWKDNGDKHCIILYKGEFTTIGYSFTFEVLHFKTKEIRDKFLEEQKELLEIAKPLL